MSALNLDKCTSGQKEIITTLDAPLMVAAGAGSGKTFTLTQRVVNARCGCSDTPAFLDSITQVCAITFTKKAAAELRSRIKQKLIEVGLVEDALAVDDAWITTIHGMASNMLREHALELGIDPTFQVIEGADEANLRDEAVNVAVAEVREQPHYLVQELLANRDMSGANFGGGIVDDALAILNRVKAMPAGFDGLVVFEPDATPSDIMKQMYRAGCDFRDMAQLWKKPTATDLKYFAALEAALELAQAWLAENHTEGFLDEQFNVQEFSRVFYALPPTSATYRNGKDDEVFFADYRALYAQLSNQVQACIGCREVQALLYFARLIDDCYKQLKGCNCLDNNDLLSQCVDMLKSNPAIAQSYRNRFKLIMIDEFQDTDKLQVQLISLIAQPQLANVCVVGDAQQSIYRFRGADVNVFFDYRSNLETVNSAAHKVELPHNFRSHADVLKVVDKIFSQPCCFGKDFLHLEPKGTVNEQEDPMFDGMSRINLDMVHYKKTTSKAKGASMADAVQVSARHVAEHFAQLRKRGACAGDMALLLGSMTKAQVYVQALRDAGFESVVSGGSVFAQSPEAQLVNYLLACAVNIHDEQALFAVLTSPLFNVSDDVLVTLVSSRDEEGCLQRRSLSAGFMDWDKIKTSCAQSSDVVLFDRCREHVLRYVCGARKGYPAQALRQLLLDSGLLDRLECDGAAGLAAAGNFAKALNLVADFQVECTGIASVASAYAQHLEGSKETPGGLSTANTDVVQIMTVHASKGLEFPHVAVAQLKTGKISAASLLAENSGDHTYVSACGSLSEDCKKVANKLKDFNCDDGPILSLDQATRVTSLHKSLKAYQEEQEYAEAQRLLYVALTRASKSLLLCHCTMSKPENCYVSDGVFGDIHQALQWDAESLASVSMCEYGGSAPARVCLTYLTTPEDAQACQSDERVDGDMACVANDSAFLMPVRTQYPAVTSVPCASSRENVWSYSSLHHEELPWETLEAVPMAAVTSDGATVSAAVAILDDATAPVAGAMLDDNPALAVGLASDDATALGSVFHALAQRAILQRNHAGGGALCAPDAQAIAVQVKRLKVTPSQESRLHDALDRWFVSSVAQEVARYQHVQAEVPFMVTVGENEQHIFLEGEIDALAYDNTSEALFIDYKTGGSVEETDSFLQEKHRLQAQCYAYALMSEGFERVRALFVRVEHPNPTTGTDVQTVEYRFAREDMPYLREVIMAAAK